MEVCALMSLLCVVNEGILLLYNDDQVSGYHSLSYKEEVGID